jgi:polyphosphate glucokinase
VPGSSTATVPTRRCYPRRGRCLCAYPGSRGEGHLRWRAWANEFSAFLERLEIYFWPDLIILGGGVSKEMKKYEKWLESRVPIRSARYLNTSGIVGAAIYASDRARAESARPVQLLPVAVA